MTEVAFHNVVKITKRECLFPHGTMGGFSTTRIIATNDRGVEVEFNCFHPTTTPVQIEILPTEHA